MVALPNTSISGHSSISMAPIYVMNQTSRAKYREKLWRWISIIIQTAQTGNKEKMMLSIVGNAIYFAYGEIAQNLLSQVEKAEKISLPGEAEDQDRSNLIDYIISVIAKDSPTEIIRQELDMLTEIHKCVRKLNEQPVDFVNRFKRAVARYFNHTTGINDNTSRQFADMLIRNANVMQYHYSL